MADLADYMEGIETRLLARQSAGDARLAEVVILREDRADLANTIDKAMGELGMLILIGQPSFQNSGQSKHAGNMTILSLLAVGEEPTIWRGKTDLEIEAEDDTYSGMGLVLFTGLTPGQAYKWTPGENEGQIESGGQILAGAGIFTPEFSAADVSGTPNAAFTGTLALAGQGPDKPIALKVATAVAEILTGFKIAGFQPLRVASGQPQPSKQRNLYEIGIESNYVLQTNEGTG